MPSCRSSPQTKKHVVPRIAENKAWELDMHECAKYRTPWQATLGAGLEWKECRNTAVAASCESQPVIHQCELYLYVRFRL